MYPALLDAHPDELVPVLHPTPVGQEPVVRRRTIFAVGRGVRLLAVAVAALTVLLPMQRAGAESAKYATAVVISGDHDASALVRLPASGVWRPTILRPTKAPVIMELVPLARNDYSYAAIVLPSGHITVNIFDGNGGGFFDSDHFGGRPPTWVRGWERPMPAGRYRLTLLTQEATKIHLDVRGERFPVRRLNAASRTTARISTATQTNPSAVDVAHQSLGFHVPDGAHQVVLFATASWVGAGTVAYQNACDTGSPSAGVPCEPNPAMVLFSANPTLAQGHWSAWALAMMRPTKTGKDTASYELAVSGSVTNRTILAVALP